MRQQGFTLVELLIGAGLLIAACCVILLGMQHGLVYSDHLTQRQVAVNAAQGQLEQLMAADIDALWAGPAGMAVPIAGLPSGMLSVRIQSADLRNPASPSLLDLFVSACWSDRGRIVGEDLNCNGTLEAGEDLNNNGMLDSPVMVTTRVARRD